MREQLFFMIYFGHELVVGDSNPALHRRKPGALHHLAFKADSRAEVDSAYEELKKIGANIVAKPQLYPEYSPTYYAVFFKDTENIKFEIVCNK